MKKYAEFMSRLAELSAETGVYIESFGDAFYNPKLTVEPAATESKKKHPIAFFSYDWVNGKYAARMENPYDGVVLEPAELPYKSGEYNPKYGNDRVCECGHPYYRHFDSYDDNYPCGCKYCECREFKEKEGDKDE